MVAAIVGLVGVIIGAAITPLITHSVESRRIKSRIKPELIGLMYLFYNYRKALLTTVNDLGFQIRFLFFKKEELITTATISEKANLEIEVELLSKSIARMIDNHKEYFAKLTEIEAKMLSVLSQVSEYYGESKYTKLENLIRPKLEASNSQQELYNYGLLDAQKISELKSSLAQILIDKAHELDKDCSKIIDKLTTGF